VANPALKTTPIAGDYGCVTILWLEHTIFGRKVKLPNILGYLIMLQTWSKYCHAFIYIGPCQNQSTGEIVDMVIEAQPKGATCSPLSKYNPSTIVWSTDELTNDQRKTIVTKAQMLIGKGYGFLDIFAQSLVRLGFKNAWLWHIVESQDRYICSQLCSKCGVAGWVFAWLCGEPDPALVTPAQLARRLATQHESNLHKWTRQVRMFIWRSHS
jgi:predicted outer membrane lipoprotein